MSAAAPPATLNLAIAGAGLLGRLLAWRLLLRDHAVTLFEATTFSQPRSAAHTAAAMISPFSEVVSAERSVYEMGLASLRIWPQWLAELNAGIPDPVQYAAKGSLAVAHPKDAAELDQFKRDIDYKLGPDNPSTWWQYHDLHHRESALEHFEQALYLPDEAHLDSRRLLDSLLQTVQRRGGRCREATAVNVDGNRIVHPNGVTECFDRVIDCRGIGAKSDVPGLRGVRGEVMWVESRELVLNHPVRLMHPRYKLYVVPKPGQRFIIGATEIESEDSSPISLQSTLELASALYTINPVLAEARVIETDTNLRPAYRNNLPRIDIDENCISVNGLYRHGYLLAPVLVEHLDDFLSHGREGEFWQSLIQEPVWQGATPGHFQSSGDQYA